MNVIRDRILNHIRRGENVLLHAPGGTGKTYLLKDIALDLIKRNILVACTAPTGVAALGLSTRPLPGQDPGGIINGSTIHSWAGIGLGTDTVDKLQEKILSFTHSTKKWRNTKVLFMDEVSMVAGELFVKLYKLGQRVRRNTAPFGGIILVVCGDFLQLPPVKGTWAFVTDEWAALKLRCVILETPQRYQDVKWFELLLRVRKAEHTKEDITFLQTRVKAYQNWLKSIEGSDTVIVKPTVLHSKKDDVSFDNEIEMRNLDTEEMSFEADDVFLSYNKSGRRDYYYKLLDDTIPKNITLKVGAQVMLKANLDVPAGYVNGSRGVIVGFSSADSADAGTSVMVKWVSGEVTEVTAHAWIIEDNDAKASRSQIPLALAWAITIHKSQGCSLDYVICDLGPTVFSPGQAYVALSRVRSSEGLFLESFYPKGIKADAVALEFVNNIEKEYAATSERSSAPPTPVGRSDKLHSLPVEGGGKPVRRVGDRLLPPNRATSTATTVTTSSASTDVGRGGGKVISSPKKRFLPPNKDIPVKKRATLVFIMSDGTSEYL